MGGLEQQLPPGLAGYVAAQNQNQQGQLAQLQQAQGMMGLQNAIQQQQKEQGFRQALTALGPNPSQDALAQVAAQFGSPADVLKTQQSSLDRKAAMEAKASEAQARLDNAKQQAEMQHEFRMSQLKTTQDRAAETERHNKALEGINAANAQLSQQLKMMGIELQKSKNEGAAQTQLNKQTQQFSAAVEKSGLTESNAVLQAAEDALKKSPKLASYLAGPLSATPDLAVGSLSPDMTKEQADDIRSGRQAFQKLFNITLKNRSGAAVTNQELDRLKNEFANGTLKTPEQLNAAVGQARNIITQHYRGIMSGFHPDAVKAYNENLKESGGTPVFETGAQASPTAAPAAPQIQKGATATGPNGQKIVFDGVRWVPKP